MIQNKIRKYYIERYGERVHEKKLQEKTIKGEMGRNSKRSIYILK